MPTPTPSPTDIATAIATAASTGQPVQIALPSGNAGQVLLQATAGELLIAGLLFAILCVLLFMLYVALTRSVKP